MRDVSERLASGPADLRSLPRRFWVLYLVFMISALVILPMVGRRAMPSYDMRFYESSTRIAGVPLYASGPAPVAIIAIGGRPRGVIALGGVAFGVIALGEWPWAVSPSAASRSAFSRSRDWPSVGGRSAAVPLAIARSAALRSGVTRTPETVLLSAITKLAAVKRKNSSDETAGGAAHRPHRSSRSLRATAGRRRSIAHARGRAAPHALGRPRSDVDLRAS